MQNITKRNIFTQTLSMLMLLSMFTFINQARAEVDPTIPVDPATVFTAIEDDAPEVEVTQGDPIITILPYDAVTPVTSLTVEATTNGTFTTPSTHTFTENGVFVFIAIGTNGNAVLVPVTITNIVPEEVFEEEVAASEAVITILPYDAVTPVTSLTVYATTNGVFTTPSSHTFTANGTYTFIAMGSNGNGVLRSVTVTNIDTTAPIITVDPYTTTNTPGPITVTAHTNEGTLDFSSHVFTTNGSFTFTATDAAGNQSTKTVTITNIVPVIVTGGGSSGSSSSGGTIDYCSNIPGNQLVVPSAYTADANRVCTFGTVTTTTTDTTPVGQVLGASKFVFTLEMALGDKNDEVKELQDRLIADGYMTGPSTGYFGLKTLAAVRKFQKAHGIRTVNGVVYTTGNVGPLTLAALNK